MLESDTAVCCSRLALALLSVQAEEAFSSLLLLPLVSGTSK